MNELTQEARPLMAGEGEGRGRRRRSGRSPSPQKVGFVCTLCPPSLALSVFARDPFWNYETVFTPFIRAGSHEVRSHSTPIPAISAVETLMEVVTYHFTPGPKSLDVNL